MKYFLASILLISSITSSAQCNIKKIHAFYREIMPGIIRTVIDEKGNPVQEKPKIRKQYLIYVETPLKRKPGISFVYIEGKKFAVQIDSVESSPILIPNPLMGSKVVNDTLVKKTNNAVWIITLMKEELQNKNAPALSKKNALLIECIFKKKVYYIQLKKLKKLEAFPSV